MPAPMPCSSPITTRSARCDGWEGMQDGVFLLVGIETSPKRGHYLAFGADEERRRCSLA
jgi:hypothetical protein